MPAKPAPPVGAVPSPDARPPHETLPGRPAPPPDGPLDLFGGQVVTFAELARLIPCRRGGRPTHVGTLHRWRGRGLKGVRLAATRAGSVWVTTPQAYQAFCDALAALSEPARGAPSPPGPRVDHSVAERLLDGFGV